MIEFLSAIRIEFILVTFQFYILNALIQVNSQQTDSLKLVQVIFRHGISTPENTYPTDPYKDFRAWPEGRGQVVKEGEKEQYELGKLIASRYKEYAHGNFQPWQTETVSSDFRKTIKSAEYFLSGLLSANYSSIIKVKPKQQDNILSFSQACPMHEKLERKIFGSRPIKHFLQEHQRILEYISFNSGLQIQTLQDFSKIYSTIYSQKYCGKILPHWADLIFDSGGFDQLLSLMLRIPTFIDEMKRLMAGPLLNIILNHMIESKQTTNSSIKLYAFSGHSETLVSVLDALDLFDGAVPTFSSAIIVELHQDQNTTMFHVEIYFNNDSGLKTEFRRLWIPKCGFACPLDQFYENVKVFLVEDFYWECQAYVFPWKALISAIILLASFPILLVIFVKILEKRRKSEDEFSPLLNSHRIF